MVSDTSLIEEINDIKYMGEVTSLYRVLSNLDNWVNVGNAVFYLYPQSLHGALEMIEKNKLNTGRVREEKKVLSEQMCLSTEVLLYLDTESNFTIFLHTNDLPSNYTAIKKMHQQLRSCIQQPYLLGVLTCGHYFCVTMDGIFSFTNESNIEDCYSKLCSYGSETSCLIKEKLDVDSVFVTCHMTTAERYAQALLHKMSDTHKKFLSNLNTFSVVSEWVGVYPKKCSQYANVTLDTYTSSIFKIDACSLEPEIYCEYFSPLAVETYAVDISEIIKSPCYKVLSYAQEIWSSIPTVKKRIAETMAQRWYLVYDYYCKYLQ